MAQSNKFKALTLDERRIIETGIRNGSTKTAIATTLGKDKSPTTTSSGGLGRPIRAIACLP